MLKTVKQSWDTQRFENSCKDINSLQIDIQFNIISIENPSKIFELKAKSYFKSYMEKN